MERNLDELTEDHEYAEFVEPSVKGNIGEELKRLHKRLASLERKTKGISSEKKCFEIQNAFMCIQTIQVKECKTLQI